MKSVAIAALLVGLVACSSSNDAPAASGASPEAGADAAPEDPGVVEAEAISKQAGLAFESEPHVAVGPRGRVAVAWIAVASGTAKRSWIGYAISTDGGATFAPPASVVLPEGWGASDPVLAAADDGSFYVALLAYTGSHTDMSGWVARTEPDGTSFAPAVRVTETTTDFIDKPWIAIAKSGAVVVTLARGRSGQGWHPIVARSTDRAATWSRTEITGARRNMIALCADAADGAVYLTSLEQRVVSFVAVVQRSDDGGATFGDAATVSLESEGLAYIPPTCAARDGRVEVLYALGEGDATDDEAFQAAKALRVARSTDRGATFPTRIDAHDTEVAPLFGLPAIAGGANATHVFYYAGAKPGDRAGALRHARTTDDKSAFAPSEVVREPIVFGPSRAAKAWLGDYMGAAWRDGRVYLAYVDNATGAAHVSFYSAKAP